MRVQYPVVECLSRDRGLRVYVSQVELHIVCKQSKEGKGQESIQSSTAHDPGHGMLMEGDKNKETSHTREPRGQPFPIR